VSLQTCSADTLRFIAQVHEAYTGFVSSVHAHGENGLGGKLFYAGELGAQGRNSTVAANIAGTATLAASSDSSALRHAMREGVIDFLVNSLDEALRILKNEIRKRQPVAVAVSLSPSTIEEEMLERGVLPDLLLPSSPAPQQSPLAVFLSQGARPLHTTPQATDALHIWLTPANYAQDIAGFEAELSRLLAPDDYFNRRWLHLSPRYLGRPSSRLRSIACDVKTAAELTKSFGPALSI
jgi:Urocanate hydratase